MKYWMGTRLLRLGAWRMDRHRIREYRRGQPRDAGDRLGIFLWNLGCALRA
jgi:hypothetical protein